MTAVSSWQHQLRALPDRAAAHADRRLFHELNPDLPHSPLLRASVQSPRPASVLIPVVERTSGPHVIFTVRTTTMPSHAGEISFPGGGPKGADTSPVDTALRETMEEIGVAPGQIDVQGALGIHYGGLGYAVTPVVGLVDPLARLIPSPREVADIFEVPLATLLDRRRHVIETRSINNISYRMFAFPYQEGLPPRHIWGLTAGILDSFSRALLDLDLT